MIFRVSFEMHYMSIPPPTWTKGEIQVGIICSIVILLLAIFWFVNSKSTIVNVKRGASPRWSSSRIETRTFGETHFKLFLALHHAETEAGRGHSKVISTRIELIKWGASSQWSFRPNSTWGCKETTTIKKTRPALFC